MSTGVILFILLKYMRNCVELMYIAVSKHNFLIFFYIFQRSLPIQIFFTRTHFSDGLGAETKLFIISLFISHYIISAQVEMEQNSA